MEKRLDVEAICKLEHHDFIKWCREGVIQDKKEIEKIKLLNPI